LVVILLIEIEILFNIKKILTFTLALFLISCENDKVFKLDPNAKIFIKPAQNGWLSETQKVKSNTEHLSALEIVKQATRITFYNVPLFGNQSANVGFAGKDTTSAVPALLRWGTDIISQNGEYVPEFIEGADFVLERITNIDKPNQIIDTIGYIPNSVLREAEAAIKAAYEAKDNEEVYRVFDEKFRFMPTTGAEWRALKAQGLN